MHACLCVFSSLFIPFSLSFSRLASGISSTSFFIYIKKLLEVDKSSHYLFYI
jgi:hypothetical protein